MSHATAAAPSTLGRNHVFTIYLVGQTISHIGHSLMHLAMPLLVLQMTGSIADMGITTGCVGAGRLAGGLLSGFVVDRVDRRLCMLACDIGSALLYALVPLLWALELGALWQIYTIAFLGNVLGNWFYVTHLAALPSLVHGSHLTAANGRLMAGQGLSIFVGSLLGGVLCATIGAPATIGLDALSFVISGIALMSIRFRRRPGDETGDETGDELDGGPRDDALPSSNILAGLRYVWRQPILRMLLVLMVAVDFVLSGSIDMFIFHVTNDAGHGEIALGVVFAIASVGAITGGLLASFVRVRVGFGAALLGYLVIMGASSALISQAASLALLAGLAGFYALGNSGFYVFTNAIRQERTPDALLGRVIAVFSTFAAIGAPLGAMGATQLAEHTSVPDVLVLIGVSCFALAMVGAMVAARGRHAPAAGVSHQ
jgi:MFS family permease